MKVIRLLITFN